MNSKFTDLVSRLKSSMLSGNKEEWLNLLMVDDDIAKQSMNKWFEDYFMVYKVKRCQVTLDESYIVDNSCEIRCLVKVQYQEGKKYLADLLLYVKEDIESKKINIVSIERFYQPAQRKNVNWQTVLKQDEPWWKCIHIKEELSDDDELQHIQLARAITRNIRFREAHIQLECASIMTTMMSQVISNICRQLELPNENSEHNLKYIYDILMDRFHLQITRPDRDNTWASKYLAPWYGIEEILSGKEEGKRIAVSCNFFMSTLYVLLRWSGFKTSHLVQFRIVNQDYLIVKTIDNRLYFISHDNITLCSQSTIYPSGTINRVFGAEWYIDFKGNAAEISPDLLGEYNLIAQNTFLPVYNPIVMEGEIMSVTPDLDSDDFRDTVLKSGNYTKSSIYPWIRYANQTLCVSKPEAYIYWSIQSNWGNLNFRNEEEIYQYVDQMENESIFPENDRLMTADQCIRHQTSGTKDRAAFLLAAFKKFFSAQGIVVFTKKYDYVVYKFDQNNIWILYNVSLHKKSKLIEGEIVLAFDDTNSYCILQNKNYEKLEWLQHNFGHIVE